MNEAASVDEFERGHTDPSLSIEWVLGDLWLPVVPVGWTAVAYEKSSCFVWVISVF